MSKKLRQFCGQKCRGARSLRRLLAGVGLFAVACSTDASNTVEVPAQTAGVQIYSENHELLQLASAFCANLQWTTCLKPEYTDDQPFMGENKQTYGPTAFIAPAEDLDTRTSEIDFQAAPVLVAYVLVPQSPLPLSRTYTDLRLGYGNHCVFLMHAGGEFKAYVVPETSGTCASYPAPLPAHELRVIAVASAAFPGHPNIPPVARFHEGEKGPNAGVPFLGIKCGSSWCLVLPQAQAGEIVKEWLPPHAGVHNDRQTWSVYGWNDSQHLALPNPNGGLMRSTMRASVVAVPNLDNITEAQYAQGFQHVATVYFTGGTAGKYKGAWNFRKGHNEVFIRKINDSTWAGEIRRKRILGGWSVKEVFVHRRDHNTSVPGTARFMWTDTDEDLWIECDDGCCRVSGSSS
jgi:hypothetical protein